MSCKWDREAEDYLSDGEPCRRDDYGDPTKHCAARRTCSSHVGSAELTCARCIGRVRAIIRRIPTLSALALPVALTLGVNSEAANIAGPAANPGDWSERRMAMRGHLATWASNGRITEEQHLHARLTMEDDDERHPANVLGRWALMIAEDYDHDLPTLTISNAADYLDRQLGRIAQDAEQDFALLGRELRKCHGSLETAVALGTHTERGAPCPDCVGALQVARNELRERGVPESEWPKLKAPRLVRQYGHWCEDENCERIHSADEADDEWQCPRVGKHVWTHKAYTDYIEDRKAS